MNDNYKVSVEWTKQNLTRSSWVHSKKCWVVLTQLWVKYGLTQPLG